MKAPNPATRLDLLKLHKADYSAPRKPILLGIAAARYLCIAGRGKPGGRDFQACVAALYGMAFTVKMTRKFAGLGDYTVSKLEAVYLNLGDDTFHRPRDLSWKLLIRTPEFVTPADLAQAAAALERRGRLDESRRVGLEDMHEGACVQLLHVGPYDREGESVERMRAFAASRGLRLGGPHHEIYLSDPRRIEPASLRTLLRRPVGE